MDNLKHSEITGAIIKSFYKVYNALGHGFLEKVYENALVIELIEAGLVVEQQRPINVYYREVLIGVDPSNPFYPRSIPIPRPNEPFCPNSEPPASHFSRALIQPFIVSLSAFIFFVNGGVYKIDRKSGPKRIYAWQCHDDISKC